ncbi:protein-tyrosine phosphatase-like protein [Powellomyces hirtus]|nr:protein-tyrosine phosphatase-like protein [Powellomyces hirtus]
MAPANPHAVINDPRSSVSFLITDCPQRNNVADGYASLLQAHNVKHLVRCCDPAAYDATPLSRTGVTVHDWFFEDGTYAGFCVGCENVRARLADTVVTSLKTLISSFTSVPSTSEKPTMALHCVSGIGRAPVLVAAALVLQGVEGEEAVEVVRKSRRGALNRAQLAWLLDDFAPKNRKKGKSKGLRRFFSRS